MVGEISVGLPLGVEAVGQLRLRIQNKQTNMRRTQFLVYSPQPACSLGRYRLVDCYRKVRIGYCFGSQAHPTTGELPSGPLSQISS